MGPETPYTLTLTTERNGSQRESGHQACPFGPENALITPPPPYPVPILTPPPNPPPNLTDESGLPSYKKVRFSQCPM